MSSIRLPGDDRAHEVDDVRITAPGLRATVEVHRGGTPGARSASRPVTDLDQVLASCGMAEDLTIELRDQDEAPPGTAVPGERSTSRGEPAIAVDVRAAGEGWGQVLLAVAEDGALSWHLPDGVGDATGQTTGDRSTGRATFTLPRRVVETADDDQPSTHRGILATVGRKLLKVLLFRAAESALGLAADQAVGWWEQRNRPHRIRTFAPGSHGVGDAESLGPEALRAVLAGGAGTDGPPGGAADDRVLLVVHGTTSTIANGFRALPDELVTHLHGRYGGRVVGFDHPTLSVTPQQNVEWFAARVREAVGRRQVTFDVLTHSRGGLVARVLAEQPALAGPDAAGLLVDRAVFGATPNAGTALADPDRVRDFVDTWTNILGFVPDNPVTSTLEVLLEIVKLLGAGIVGGLPGLQSMDPDGDLLAGSLNVAGSGPRTGYRALTAEYEPSDGEGLDRFVRDRLTDGVFQGVANDLVVPTDGVHAGNGADGFPVGDVLAYAASRGIDHSSLWGLPETSKVLTDWLTG